MIYTSPLHNIQMELAGSVLALALAACCPYPHFERQAPVFEGTLIRQRTASANVPVTLSTRINSAPGCSNPKVETLTDASRKFHLDPPQYLHTVISHGDRRDAWSLCFKFPDALGAVWDSDGYWGGPSLQILECLISDDKSPSGTLRLGKIAVGTNLTGYRVESISGAARKDARSAAQANKMNPEDG